VKSQGVVLRCSWPDAATDEALRRVHDATYLDAMRRSITRQPSADLAFRGARHCRACVTRAVGGTLL
jgi:hypothetical protein